MVITTPHRIQSSRLYLLLSLTLGVFVASGVLSRHTLRTVRARLRPGCDVFAGAPVELLLEVENRSRLLPASGVVCRLEGLPGRVMSPRIPPRGTRRLGITTVFPRRGSCVLPAVQVEVRLPLGFFEKAVSWRQEGELLVFPRRVHGAAPRLARLGRRESVAAAGGLNRGGEVEQLRDFHTGDDRRDIHWKQTARQQRLIVVERRERATTSRYLVLDRQLPRRDDSVLAERFEDLVSEVTTAALDQARHGWPVGLVVGSVVTPPAVGRGHLRRLLTQLALVQPVGPGEDPLPAALRGEGVYRLAGGGG